MKSTTKKLVLALAFLLMAVTLSGCANMMLGASGPAPAEDIFGVWIPSGKSASEESVLKLYAGGNARFANNPYTWRVDPEASDPGKIHLVAPDGEATVVAFTYDHEKDLLSVTGLGEKGSVTLKRDLHLSSPAFGTLPDFAVPEGSGH